MLWPWYIFSIQTRPDLSSHITKSYIFSSCNRSYSYALIIDFGISSVVKPEPREFKKTEKKKKRKTGSCRMSDALRGVVWSSASYSSSSANTITSLNILRFIWRCFTVAIVVMSLRAFYDCTLIVEALFYIESYFRIQYVLLYIKCIVWRKLNKCCLKTTVSLWNHWILCNSLLSWIIVLVCAVSQFHTAY